MIKLGVNIDHIATLRQARKEGIPPLHLAALEAQKGGADGITVHLREDRRHIQDSDIPHLKETCRVPLNLEMALVKEIIRFALRVRPQKVCIVPEKRQELTTEGGLNVVQKKTYLKRVIPQFRKRKIEVSLFIDPSLKQIQAAAQAGADAVELHTGTYANSKGAAKQTQLKRLRVGARYAQKLGLRVNAGHGLDYQNVRAVARIANMHELNIGYSIVCYSVFVGLRRAVHEMKRKIR